MTKGLNIEAENDFIPISLIFSINRVLLRIPNTRSSKTNYFKFSFYLKQTHFYKKIGLFMYVIFDTKSHRLFSEKNCLQK